MIRAIAKIVDLLPGLADPKGTADIGKKSPAACPPTATLTTSAAADATSVAIRSFWLFTDTFAFLLRFTFTDFFEEDALEVSEAAADFAGRPRCTFRFTSCGPGIDHPILAAASFAASMLSFIFSATFANGTVRFPFGSR